MFSLFYRHDAINDLLEAVHWTTTGVANNMGSLILHKAPLGFYCKSAVHHMIPVVVGVNKHNERFDTNQVTAF